MIVGPRMILLKPWRIDNEHDLEPGNTVILIKMVDFCNDVARIDISGIVGSGDLSIVDVPISELRKHVALEG